jgi:D-lactate dehydrogenase (cytochrome)
VEPGCILSDLLQIFESKNLFYPPDPTEKNCFIGGTVATNASGEKTFKYGPTRDYVNAINVVLANGETLKLKRGENKSSGYYLKLNTEEGTTYILNIPDYHMPDTKNTSGYFAKENMDAIDLFIGSEGTLGVITSITLKLLQHSGNILSAVVFFNDELNALNFITAAKEKSYTTRSSSAVDIDALALEFFDANSLKFLLEDYPNIPSDAKAAVWFEQETQTEDEDLYLEKWSELISEFQW